MLTLYNAQGQPIKLTSQIGEGGEGKVYRVAEAENQVAKIYHTPPPPAKVQKIAAMVASKTPQLVNITSWPLDMLYTKPKPAVAGILMPRLVNYLPIHELYGPKSRKQKFPQANWKFLIHTATNLARAFALVHAHQHVVGDINYGNIVVAKNATIKFIDCDSFQISFKDKLFLCEVGVPEYTSPELAAFSVPRTPNHDAFGLAVLIFQLLFMGKHPFAGTFQGQGECSLEQAIREYRFAYGAAAKARLMAPPQNALPLTAVPTQVAGLFEQAFVKNTAAKRPTALEWAAALSAFAQNIKRCDFSHSHQYFAELATCSWCALETTGRVMFFNFVAPKHLGQFADLNALWDLILVVTPPDKVIEPTPKRPTTAPSQKAVNIKRTRPFFYLGLVSLFLAGVASLAIASVYPGFYLATYLFGLACLVCLGLGRGVFAYEAELTRQHKALTKEWQQLQTKWQAAASGQLFKDKYKALENVKNQYLKLDQSRAADLQKLKSQAHDKQLEHFLEQHQLAHHEIAGIGPQRKTVLLSYGIETAADVKKPAIMAIPGFGEKLTERLLDWRTSVEKKFVFDPTKGLEQQDVAQLDADLALKRQQFKNILAGGPKELLQVKAQILETRQKMLPQVAALAQKLAQVEADKKFLT